MPTRTTAPPPGGWRIAVVEDHVLQRTLTERLVDEQADMRVVFSGEALPDLVDWLGPAPRGMRPHLVLLDLMVDRRAPADPETVRRLSESGIRVLVFSALGSPSLVQAMIRAGADGVLGKRDAVQDVVIALRSVLAGEEWMTAELAAVIAQDAKRPRFSVQEERALVLYASGLTIEAVAEEIGVRRDTAKKYLQRVKAKYAAVGRPVRSKLELSRAAGRDGLLALRRAHSGG
ncbi:response regulator [Microbacterium sp. NPDC055683]